VKETIKERLLAEATQYAGTAVTFTLIEYVRENFEELTKDQVPRKSLFFFGFAFFYIDIVEDDETKEESIEKQNSDDDVQNVIGGTKKLQMTKAQKRRMWDHTDASKLGEKERGWNWVDIIKHLSQTRDAP
ncbi:unnamed protein product, partial [Gongylonema pulchrum]|uniref:RWD domain-containing protein n=1 Tax=Gongylonema pulchrum TaxID=637853 RepID=A0A183DX51_9BILA